MGFQNTAMARQAGRLARVLFPVAIFAICGWLLAQRITLDMVAALPARLAEFAIWQWAVAFWLTAISLYSVGRYDVLAHRYFETRLPERAARWTGSIGIAVGQTLGFGLITGAVARWRMLPALGLGGALKLSAFVSVSFVMAWAVIFSGTSLLLPAPVWAKWLGLCGTVAMVALLACTFRWPTVRWGRLALRLPSWRLSGGILGWALVDTFTAAGVLFMFLPPGSIGFLTFLPLFLIALGAALVSNTPGGLGPFELILISTLPMLDIEAVMTAILAYRCAYYAVPAMLGGLALMVPFRKATRGPETRLSTSGDSPRSEAAVVWQNGGAIERSGPLRMALWPTGQTLTLMTDPVRGAPQPVLKWLRARAQDQALQPFVYKCGPRLAQAARQLGWRVLHVADDAVVCPQGYALDSPTRRTLRRKLRAAEKAGVSVQSGGPLPHAHLAKIDAAWQVANGPARGGSMGRYCPQFLVDQWVGTAWVDGTCVAFVTAHVSAREWCLDIMRQGPNTPDGTMHMLVHAAIEAAARAGVPRFCLAAVPACPDPSSALWRRIAQEVVVRTGGPGLRQFKSNFGPNWVPRYVAAPNGFSLALGLADVAFHIHHPVPLDQGNSSAPHYVDEKYELASRSAA